MKSDTFFPTCFRIREELVLHTYGEGNERGVAGDGKAARAFYNNDESGFQRRPGSGNNSDGGGIGRRSSSKHWIGTRGFGKTDQRRRLVRRRQLGWGQNPHGGNPIYRGESHLLVEDAETNLPLTGNRNKLDWIEIDQKGERNILLREELGFKVRLSRDATTPSWATGPRWWHAGERKGKKSNGPAGFWPKSRFQIIFFSFSNLFYKLQINLNSNQIWISTTSTHTIKYKSTSSHQEKYAMAWMQQIIV
jgi:hypothetical protein